MISLTLISFARTADTAIRAALDAAKKGASISTCQQTIAASVKDWSPVIKGKRIVTPALRAALVGALGHLAFNLIAADSGKELI